VTVGPATGLGARLGPAVTFATTEHFNLQTARALTVSEANGRASIYLAALSGSLIALAFVGQMSRLGAAFYAFALILLPVLAFVGVVTFLRLVQSSIEDLAYARRIALLRSFYLRLSPELEPYLAVVTEARPAKPPSPGAWQLTLTAAGMVAVINSVVIGACAGLLLEAAGIHSLAIPVALGAVIGAAAFTLHERHHRRTRDAYSPEAVDRAAERTEHAVQTVRDSLPGTSAATARAAWLTQPLRGRSGRGRGRCRRACCREEQPADGPLPSRSARETRGWSGRPRSGAHPDRGYSSGSPLRGLVAV